MATKLPLEEQEQKIVVKYLKIKKILHYATINENKQSFSDRVLATRIENKSKAMGKSNGVPDLCICKANKYYHGLYIEMKRRVKTLKNGKKSISRPETRPEQLKWLDKLNSNGYYAVVCYGADEAIKVIDEYMENVE